MNKQIMISTLVATVFILMPRTSHARYLNTDIGRFTTMDTYAGNNEDPLSLHKYLYGESNPVSNTDPSGDQIDEICFAMETLAGLAALPNVVENLSDSDAISEPLQIRITPPQEIFGSGASILNNKAVEDGAWATIWVTMKARFSQSDDFVQEIKGKEVLDGSVKYNETDFQDDGYSRKKEPKAYKDSPDDTTLFSDWDDPGADNRYKTYDVSLDFRASIVDRTTRKPIGPYKLYGFKAKGKSPNVKFTDIYGYDNNAEYWPR